jgi:hypothetical protein
LKRVRTNFVKRSARSFFLPLPVSFELQEMLLILGEIRHRVAELHCLGRASHQSF